MRSRLFQAVVGVGIALGTASSGCLGESALDEAPSNPDGTDQESAATSGGDATSDGPKPSGSDSGSASQGSSGLDASSTVGGSQGTGGTGASVTTTMGAGGNTASVTTTTGAGGNTASVTTTTGVGGNTASVTTTTGASNNGGSEPVDPAQGGVGGVGGSVGDAGSATTTDGGEDPIFDPYCDAAWPTTKGAPPSPPTCVDPNNECADAGYPMRCLPLFDDASCDYGYLETQSPFCIDGAWLCAPGLVSAADCRCFGPLPDGQICGENGPEPQDG